VANGGFYSQYKGINVTGEVTSIELHRNYPWDTCSIRKPVESTHNHSGALNNDASLLLTKFLPQVIPLLTL